MGGYFTKEMKKLVISQPRYLPVISYLQRLYFADIFVFLDNVQRQPRGVENRNKIIVNGKEKWLSIPVKSSCLGGIKMKYCKKCVMPFRSNLGRSLIVG